jgi:hypothetical protein
MAWNRKKPKNQPNAPDDALDAAVMQEQWAAIDKSLWYRNWAANAYGYPIWPAGDTSAPAYHRLTGAGAAIARAGTGLADTNKKFGEFCAKVTPGGGAVAVFEQRLVQAASFGKFGWLKGRYFAAAVWVKASSANAVRLGIYDGVGTTYSTTTMPIVDATLTGWHSGSGSGGPDSDGWELLYAVRQLASGGSPATELALRVEGNAGSNAFYVDALAGIPGEIPPDYPMQGDEYDGPLFGWGFPGTIATVTGSIGDWRPEVDKPCLVNWARARIGTAPGGQDVRLDLKKNGSTSLFAAATDFKIVAGASSGNAEPNASSYASRCFAQGDYIASEISQVGSSPAGSGLSVVAYGIRFRRPQDRLVARTEID